MTFRTSIRSVVSALVLTLGTVLAGSLSAHAQVTDNGDKSTGENTGDQLPQRAADGCRWRST